MAWYSVEHPLRNRSAQADQVRSELEYRQAQLRMLQLQNQVGSKSATRSSRWSRTGRVLSLRKKDAPSRCNRSRGAEEIRPRRQHQLQRLAGAARHDPGGSEPGGAMAAYEKSRVELDRVTAKTLARLNISIDDAIVAEVQKTPSVPNVAPAPPTPNNPDMNIPNQNPPQTMRAPEPAPEPAARNRRQPNSCLPRISRITRIRPEWSATLLSSCPSWFTFLSFLRDSAPPW